MELIDSINQIVMNALRAAQLTDLAVGTVESISPLSVKLDTSQQVIRQEILYRTEAVLERKLKLLDHTHSTPEGTSGPGRSAVEVMIDGKVAPVRDGYVILSSGLAAGDKVLLLAVLGGQKFIILSRIV